MEPNAPVTFLGWVCDNDPDYQALERLYPITGTFLNPAQQGTWLGAVYRVPASNAGHVRDVIGTDFRVQMSTHDNQKDAEDWVRRELGFTVLVPEP